LRLEGRLYRRFCIFNKDRNHSESKAQPKWNQKPNLQIAPGKKISFAHTTTIVWIMQPSIRGIPGIAAIAITNQQKYQSG
jgi:hypothetical protein